MASIISTYKGMAPVARWGLAIGLAVILLGTLAALYWLFSSRQALLFGNLPEAEAAEVAAALEEWKVPHGFTEDGAGILVDQEQLHNLRMRLVSAGIPTGGHTGYELFDDNEFGVTEFAQRINYQRALQGELERTIAALPGVQDVRVHLSIRRTGLFLDDAGQSKASVALSLAPGRQLERRQLTGIRNLVASAVEGLAPESVVIVGPSGLQLGGGGEGELAAAEQSESSRELGTALESRLQRLLAEALPGKQASVSVDVTMNFDRVHRTSERLLGRAGSDDGVIVKRSSNGARPPEAGAPVAMLNEQVEYAHGTEREEVVRAAGKVERISVAVMLPHSVSTAEQGRLQRLLSAAAGLDLARGDRLEIALAPEPVVARTAADMSDRVAGSEMKGASPASASMSRSWLAWAALPAWLLGLAMGALLLGRRASSPRLLNAAESEAAARKIRIWLADGAV